MISQDIFKKLTLGIHFKKKEELQTLGEVKLIDKSENDSSFLTIEQINVFRKHHKIYVYGADVPKPITHFDSKLFGEIIYDNLNKLGYKSPTPVQMQAIPLFMEKREILVCAPTGSGKTAAFLLPLLKYLKNHKRGLVRSLIISPTRELSRQTYLFCKALTKDTSIKVHLLPKVTNNKCQKYKDDHVNYDIICTTPNRLNLLLNEKRALINLSNIEWLIIDESDKLFEIGFRDQLTKIYAACDSGLAKRAMFSATYSNHLDDWCKENLYDYVTVCIGNRNIPIDSVNQELYFAGNEAGKLIGLQQIIKKGWDPPVLIFVQSKDRAQQLYNQIKEENIKVDIIHSNRPQIERDRVVREFRQGNIWTLICTDLLSRGLDFKDIRLVINYDFPSSAISYIHRIGRTGRAGNTGRAVTFFTHEDVPYLKPIYEIIKRSGKHNDTKHINPPNYMNHLKSPPKNLKKQIRKRAIIRPKVGSQKTYASGVSCVSLRKTKKVGKHVK